MFLIWIFPKDVPGLAQRIKKHLGRYPKHRMVMLCNEQFVADILNQDGIEAIFCNHNCLVNENYFTINETADAVGARKHRQLVATPSSGMGRQLRRA